METLVPALTFLLYAAGIYFLVPVVIVAAAATLVLAGLLCSAYAKDFFRKGRR